ncbi:hypothetical protein LUZ60_017769 [Juncus effusus]|nr:hypothetical protein LUZ60_017769 [Juncus effusus]
MVGSNAEMMNTITFIITPILALVTFLWLRKYENGRRGKARKLPPAFTNFVKSPSPNALDNLLNEQLSKNEKIFSTRYNGEDIIISADVDLNSFSLKNEKVLFNNFFPPQVHTLLGESGLFLSASDPRYKQMKSLTVGFLHSWEIQTSFLEEVQKAADRVLSTWKHKDVVLLRDEAERFNFNIIAKKCLGLTADDPEGEQLQRALSTLVKGIWTDPTNIPSSIYCQALNARENIITMVMKMMESKERKSAKAADWIDWLWENDPNSSIENFYDAVILLSSAGIFTTAASISLAVYFLSNCPRAVQQMREEYLQILRAKKDGKTMLIWNEYKNLEFTQCVINETLRLGNVISFIPKMAKEDVDFKGFLIPKRNPIMIYLQATHLDPTIFENPQLFDPWRWQSMDKTNCFFAFGGKGVRQCNGEHIARIQIAIFLHRFFLNYKWEPVEPDHPIADPIAFPKQLPIRVYPLNHRSNES